MDVAVVVPAGEALANRAAISLMLLKEPALIPMTLCQAKLTKPRDSRPYVVLVETLLISPFARLASLLDLMHLLGQPNARRHRQNHSDNSRHKPLRKATCRSQ